MEIFGPTCYCKPGFVGVHCEIDIGWAPCSNHTCQNNGTCIAPADFPICLCAPGFSGEYCQNRTNGTSCDLTCYNGGTCHEGIFGPTCVCPPGFYGRHCEHGWAPCSNHTCQNNGTCIRPADFPICLCAPGFSGEYCQNHIISDPCFDRNCFNGGSCNAVDDLPICICEKGYSGDFCQEADNACASGPCMNGGLCRDSNPNTFECYCPTDFSGPRCEIAVGRPNGVLSNTAKIAIGTSSGVVILVIIVVIVVIAMFFSRAGLSGNMLKSGVPSESKKHLDDSIPEKVPYEEERYQVV
ncbi:delta-like protein 4 isoform X3 [Lytechinus variegatus]|uniref:delta-like protein 4 isoform X3 n=1 Tax=Lytechinus variegatus TaxID=7654 RepID=UPI001BB15E5E|nr:delta-like protein 4 isoform X3 [Lytechinus variegatus]